MRLSLAALGQARRRFDATPSAVRCPADEHVARAAPAGHAARAVRDGFPSHHRVLGLMTFVGTSARRDTVSQRHGSCFSHCRAVAKADRTSDARGRRRGTQPAVPAELDIVISSVLHRLRTPLTAIKGWNELLTRRVHQASRDEMRQLLLETHAAIIGMQSAIDEIAAEGLARSTSIADPATLSTGSKELNRQDVQPPAASELAN